jgi:DNA-binding response OmpR family regulator
VRDKDATIAAQEACIDALRAQVAEMRAALRCEVDEYGLQACGLTHHQALLLGFLLKKGRASSESIFQWFYGGRADGGPSSNAIKVQICHIRKKLPPGAEIELVHGWGYAISPQSREVLRQYAERKAQQEMTGMGAAAA